MLDFVTVDRELGDVSLSAAIVTSRRLGLETPFEEMAQRELVLGKKALARVVKAAEALLEKAEADRTS
jgi:hypothetical protein